MKITNFKELKTALKEKRRFQIIRHYYNSAFVGQIRVPTESDKHGFYSVVWNEPDNFVSKANRGKGLWMSYCHGHWEFHGDVCVNVSTDHKPIMAIKFMD